MADQLQLDQQSRSTGKVSWFGDSKGYGFITPDDGGEDLFVHQSSIKSDGYRSLTVGESVEFTVSTGNGGKAQAVDVTAIGGSPINKRDRRGGAGYGGGWRGGNDRRNGGGCYNCGDLNHLARDCDREGYGDRSKKGNGDFDNNGGGDECYNCGGVGHFARDCRKDDNVGGGSGKCFNCGKFGHFARDCNSRGAAGGGGGDGACYVCGDFGHLARDCNGSRGSGGGGGRFEGSTCFKCGNAGHFARECPNLKASA
ncbi:hypothetical protein SLE2022_009990 [Rubroshorea leprosula]